MEGSVTPVGAVTDALAEEDLAFWTSGTNVPTGFFGKYTRVNVYVSGAGSVEVTLGEFGFQVGMWTDLPGLEALIGHLMAAKVRAEISGIEFALPPAEPAPVEATEPTDVPF